MGIYLQSIPLLDEGIYTYGASPFFFTAGAFPFSCGLPFVVPA
jgi:hypothetical protein